MSLAHQPGKCGSSTPDHGRAGLVREAVQRCLTSLAAAKPHAQATHVRVQAYHTYEVRCFSSGQNLLGHMTAHDARTKRRSTRYLRTFRCSGAGQKADRHLQTSAPPHPASGAAQTPSRIRRMTAQPPVQRVEHSRRDGAAVPVAREHPRKPALGVDCQPGGTINRGPHAPVAHQLPDTLSLLGKRVMAEENRGQAQLTTQLHRHGC